MMKKKNLVALMIGLLVVIGGWAVYDNSHNKTEYKFDDFCRMSTDAASRVMITDCKSGKITMVDNQETIDELIKDLGDTTYNKVKKQPSINQGYAVTLFAGDEQVANVQFKSNEQCEVDGLAYNIESNMIEKIEEIAK